MYICSHSRHLSLYMPLQVYLSFCLFLLLQFSFIVLLPPYATSTIVFFKVILTSLSKNVNFIHFLLCIPLCSIYITIVPFSHVYCRFSGYLVALYPLFTVIIFIYSIYLCFPSVVIGYPGEIPYL
jgi:hypothetical protein